MATTPTTTHESQTKPKAQEKTVEELGLDEVDAASAASMDASDPPSFGGSTGVGSATPDDEAREHRIRARAHQLWELAGRPYGAEMEFWLSAEAEIDSAEADRGVER
ncbi:MAG: DUF2934 domain-containing protein [Geminicoccaceae bacterium]